MQTKTALILFVIVIVVVVVVYWYLKKKYGAMLSLAEFLGNPFKFLGVS